MPKPQTALRPATPGPRHAAPPASWADYLGLVRRQAARFDGRFKLRQFDYLHPARLQPTGRRNTAYAVPVAYTDWGPAEAPLLLCCGGVANVAMRFAYLAAGLAAGYRVVCMDWVGRGDSGWLAQQADYSLATYTEQLRQMIGHLGGQPLAVLGSSLGGSAAIELIAQQPGLVRQLVLNDVGPFIPAARRRRRATAIARHYVFRSPADLLRRIGAAAKHDGPASDQTRLLLSFHQTRWSDEEGGRVYRHDLRAMQAYRDLAQTSLVQWPAWQRVSCPVLLVHGLQSDALNDPTIRRMRRTHPLLSAMHVPDTGHTPLLADRNQVHFIGQWLAGKVEAGSDWSVLHAPARQAWR